MTFYNGNTDATALVNLIADQLIATGAWVDADPVLDGVDVDPLDTQGGQRVVSHATDANFYVLLDHKRTSHGSYWKCWQIAITISSDWDAVNHVPAGTQNVTGIPVQAYHTHSNPFSSSGYYNAISDPLQTIQFWAWIDDQGVNVLAAAVESDGRDYSTFFILERNTTKEFSDGYTNFFVQSYTNSDPNLNVQPSSSVSSRQFFRYYASPSGSNYYANARQWIRPFNTESYDRTQGVMQFMDAFKSLGNDKVYYEFPWYSNNLDPSRPILIAQTDRWLRIQQDRGIADGDILDYVNGAEVWKYLVKTIQSADSAAFIAVAVRYA